MPRDTRVEREKEKVYIQFIYIYVAQAECAAHTYFCCRQEGKCIPRIAAAIYCWSAINKGSLTPVIKYKIRNDNNFTYLLLALIRVCKYSKLATVSLFRVQFIADVDYFFIIKCTKLYARVAHE